MPSVSTLLVPPLGAGRMERGASRGAFARSSPLVHLRLEYVSNAEASVMSWAVWVVTALLLAGVIGAVLTPPAAATSHRRPVGLPWSAPPGPSHCVPCCCLLMLQRSRSSSSSTRPMACCFTAAGGESGARGTAGGTGAAALPACSSWLQRPEALGCNLASLPPAGSQPPPAFCCTGAGTSCTCQWQCWCWQPC